MKLVLKNIGKVAEASVDINGITVIAGDNDTGKSTVGRALFAIFNSMYNLENQVKSERCKSVENLLIASGMGVRATLKDAREKAEEITIEGNKYRNAIDELTKEKLCPFLPDEFKKDENNVDRMLEVLKVSDEDIVRRIFEKKLEAEFNGQVRNIYSEVEGEINLTIRDEHISVIVDSDDKVKLEGHNDISLGTEGIYIDDPFVMDELKRTSWFFDWAAPGHRYHLRRLLMKTESNKTVVDEIITNDRLDDVYEKIKTVCDGSLVITNGADYGYKSGDGDKTLDVRNLSTGLKTFVILKSLLLNGSIENNGTVILDEPEIHLHPEWQLLLAEIIVLLQKKFGLHVLLNTHSPYFLRAIQVYSAKHSVREICKYYLSEMKGKQSVITDVTDNVELIYEKLAAPLQRLENERWPNE